MALLLVLITALTGLGAGVLALARRQALAARTTGRVLQARIAAESGLLGLVGGWPAGADSIPVGGQVVGPSHAMGASGASATTIRRLSSELFLVHSVGRTSPGRVTSRVASAVWVLAPASRLATQGVVVASGGGLTVQDGGLVDGADTHRIPTGWDPEQCLDLWQVVDSLFPNGDMGAFGTLSSDGSRSTWRADGTLRPLEVPSPGHLIGLGLIPLDTLASVSAPLGPSFQPGDSSCAMPLDAAGLACARTPGIWGGTGRLEVSAGAASGILAVDGDLLLMGDARFAGWILASGDVDLRDDVRVEGVIRAGRSVRVEDRAVAAGSPCAALAVLRKAWLRNPRKMPHFSHLGPLSDS